jgi:hypothetical protein
VILKRCPSCHGFCDVELGTRCFACGTVLSDSLPTLTRRPPPALRRAQKDAKSSVVLLSTFAVLGILGVALIVIPPMMEPLPRVALAGFTIVAIALGSFARSTPAGSAPREISRLMFRMLAGFGIFIGCIIGLLLLLSFACAAGGAFR